MINSLKNTFNISRRKRPYGVFGITISYLILIILSLVVIIPFFWLVISSFKSNEEFITYASFFPKKFTFKNYVDAWFQVKLYKAFINSALISVGATLLTSCITAMAAYVFARMKFKGSNLLYALLMTGLLVPSTSIFVPSMTVTKILGLYDTRSILVLIYTAIMCPMGLFILRGFIAAIPREIEDAAEIDGCGYARKFLQVVLPLIKPGLVTVATFTFINSWSEFMFAVLLTSSEAVRTLQVAASFFKEQFISNYTAQYAATIMISIPSLVLFLLFQKHVISGLTSGAVKG